LEVLRIMDELEEEIAGSPRIPMTGKIIVESEVLLDLLDKIRSLLPEEIRQAQWVTRERERLIKEAESDAKRIISEAQEEVKKLADESEVMKEANTRANTIIEEAQKKANDIMQGANEYAYEVLRDLEETLVKAITVIRKGQSELSGKEKK